MRRTTPCRRRSAPTCTSGSPTGSPSHGLELVELDEVVGYHLEQAARYMRELGRPDPELEVRAALRLGEAGSKACLRSDAHAAANLLERALSLLPPDDPRRAPFLIELIGTLEGAAPPEEQFRRIDELEQSSNPAVRMHGRVARLQLRLLTDPADVVDQAEQVTEEALSLFSDVGDDLGLAHTYYLIAWINWLQSRAKPTQAAYDQVLRHARKVNSRALVGRATIQQMGPLYYGPFTVDEIRLRLEQLHLDGSALGRIAALSIEADLLQRDGRFDETLTLLADVKELHVQLGVALGIVITMQRRAEALADAGRDKEAATAFREVIAQLDALGMTSFRSTTMISLGDVLYRLGETDEAERLAVEGEALGAAEDVDQLRLGPCLARTDSRRPRCPHRR